MKKHLLNIAMIAIVGAAFIACNKGKEDETIPVTSVQLNYASDTLIVGETLQLTRTVLPADATNKTSTWKSSDDAIATVNTTGVVTAVSVGIATITVTTADGNKTANCTVTVIPAKQEWDAGQWGTASFATDSTWKVGTQEWSDAVQTTICSGKETYNGGENPNFLADCRSNPGQKGNLFSWQMVSEYGNVLCPEGWHVPTAEDFKALDVAFGGAGAGTSIADSVNCINNYIGRWGATLNGECDATGVISKTDANANYWSSTTHATITQAAYKQMVARLTYTVSSPGLSMKPTGSALRCVR